MDPVIEVEFDAGAVLGCGDKTNHKGHYWWEGKWGLEWYCEGYYIPLYAGSYADDNDDGFY